MTTTDTAAAPRLANIELLRIIAMMAVIIVHLDGAALGLPTPTLESWHIPSDVWRIIVEAITIVGVNCFTLISGYFGIRASGRGLVRFTLMCMFYSIGIFCAVSAVRPSTFSVEGLIESFMVFTHTDLWYVPAYLILYLLSPMLNAAVNLLPLRRFTLWLGLLVLANVWMGWFNGATFNPTGYTPMQLIMVYLLGRWLALVFPGCKERRLRLIGAATYIGATAVTALMATLMPPLQAYAYNAPWTLVASLGLFTLFASTPFHSRAVCTMARGAFAAYIIHKNPAVWGGLIRPLALKAWGEGSLALYSIFTLTFASAVYLISSAADVLRRCIFRLLRLPA